MFDRRLTKTILMQYNIRIYNGRFIVYYSCSDHYCDTIILHIDGRDGIHFKKTLYPEYSGIGEGYGLLTEESERFSFKCFRQFIKDMSENKHVSFIIHAVNGSDILYYNNLTNDFSLNLSIHYDVEEFTVCLTDDERLQFVNELNI